jgi:Aldo/keto reductase family
MGRPDADSRFHRTIEHVSHKTVDSSGAALSPAALRGQIELGAKVTVNGLGFGAMRLARPGSSGGPHDDEAARRVLRRTVELGVKFIDTARAYGASERLIAEALHPYPDELIVATRGRERARRSAGGDSEPRPAEPELAGLGHTRRPRCLEDQRGREADRPCPPCDTQHLQPVPIDLAERIDTLHVLRMLELLGGEIRLDAEVSSIVVVRLQAMLRKA